MGGRREVSVISLRLMTGSDLKHEKLFFRESVSVHSSLAAVPDY